MKSRILWPRPKSYYARNNWAGRLRVGESWVLDSPFNNAVAHQLAMCLFLASPRADRSAEIETVQAELYRANPIASADTAAIRVVTGTGTPVLFYTTHAPEGQIDPEIFVRGTKGSIHWNRQRTLIKRADGSTREQAGPPDGGLRKCVTAGVLARLSSPTAFVCDLDMAGTHTLAVNGAHESSVIGDIPPALVRTEPHRDSTRLAVAGIDAAMAQALAEEKLLSEIGVPWARAGEVVSMRGYTAFPRPGSPVWQSVR